jgi:hypothetical protein
MKIYSQKINYSFRPSIAVLSIGVVKANMRQGLWADDMQYLLNSMEKKYGYVKGKAISLQAWTGPEGSRKLRLPDFKKIGK